MSNEKLPAKASSSREIDAFLKRAAKLPTLVQTKGRLIFAIDATMSRQPTWNRATEIQSDMFAVAQSIGGLAVQLVYFRGAGEFQASEWTASANVLANRMGDVTCRSGFTQLRRVLAHANAEARQTKVGALVYIGDCFEELGIAPGSANVFGWSTTRTFDEAWNRRHPKELAAAPR